MACFLVVTVGETASWLDGELYHRECARWRSNLYHGQAVAKHFSSD
jgi:hypothetical protein